MNTDNNDIVKFEKIYIAYYSKFKRFAKEYVIREEDAENIVQDLFLELWENKYFLIPQQNLFSFLFTSLKNKCIDYIRHINTANKVTEQIQADYVRLLKIKFDALEILNEENISQLDVEKVIQDALNQLPDRCRQIFILNKIEKKKQSEIAKELNISINTVESQMAVAYKKLRVLLKDLTLLSLFF
jgi:RNA polymerase sigma-70 factor (ECF subfamily)